MKQWIKENLVLVSGILLPVLLVGAFFILNSAPMLLADPPQYDFIMVAYSYDYQHPVDYFISFEVRNDKLTGKVAPRKETNTNYRHSASVLRYSTSKNSFQEIAFDLPEDLDDIDESIPLKLTATEELTLDKRKLSPDGYSLEFIGNSAGGGLLGELFGMGRRYDSGYFLKKDNATFELPKPTSNTNYYQNDLQFMGWVIDEESSL